MRYHFSRKMAEERRLSRPMLCQGVPSNPGNFGGILGASDVRVGAPAFSLRNTSDVLAHIAYLRPPLKRAEQHRDAILSRYDPRQREFIDFVLDQYVLVGESELNGDKLPELLQLKYGSPADAIGKLGSVAEIRSTFRGFQSGLYTAGE